ncbi:MAG: hypothetical protein KGZ52_01405 [Xanthomonadaceae bacterium]|nr:hypothetical protein [Xanthomonadaceae bacterium]
MSRDHYQPVPFNVDAAQARWAKRPGFAAAFAALDDEFAVLSELLRARQAAGMTQAVDCELRNVLTPAEKPKRKRVAAA